MEVEEAPKQKMQEDLYNIPWIEKYRPKVLDDLISHDNILRTRTSPLT